MFKFNKGQDPIIDSINNAIGSRERYIALTQVYSFTSKEKEKLIVARIRMQKKKYDDPILKDVYDLLVKKGVIDPQYTQKKPEKQNVKESLIHVKDYSKQTGINEATLIAQIKAGELAGKAIMKEWYVDTSLSKDIQQPASAPSQKKQTETTDSESSQDRPKSVKAALVALWLSFIIGIVISLFLLLNALLSNKSANAFYIIGLISGISIVLNWYVIKAISNGVKWVKTAYLILVFISLFTFIPSLSVLVHSPFFMLIYFLQELLAIFASIGLLLPSSTKWFNAINKEKQRPLNSSELQESVINAIKNKPNKVNSMSYLDEIRKLGELKKEGLITEEEFIQKKQQLLSS